MLEAVDDALSLMEIKHVDVSTSTEMIAWRVWPRPAHSAVACRPLVDVIFPESWTPVVVMFNVGFDLKPTRPRGSAVHVQIHHPIVIAVPVTTIPHSRSIEPWLRIK